MDTMLSRVLVLLGCFLMPWTSADLVPLPHFRDLARFYPGYSHHGGRYHNHHIIAAIGLNEEDSALLLHDTSALRLSYSLNRIGGRHSLGRQLIRLSKFGHDSVSGADGLEYMFHPIAYGPYLADKYGYPNVTKLHAQDPVSAKRNFWGRQGILRVITYTKKRNLPKGHVALWDCNHFHQSKDWMAGHSLLTVEFWQSPDSDCSQMDTDPRYLQHTDDLSGGSYRVSSKGHRPVTGSGAARDPVPAVLEASRPHPHLRHKHWERQYVSRHHLGGGRVRRDARGQEEAEDVLRVFS